METKLTISRSLIMKNCLWWELMSLFARTNILNEVLDNILNGNFSENLCARKHHRPCGRSVITHKRFEIVIKILEASKDASDFTLKYKECV